MAVFAGGATLEAAGQVCARLPDGATGPPGGGEVPAWEVFDLLNALVDKSLLIATGDDQPRYRMLETIRAYGLERLAEAGEQERVRRAHAAYFLALAMTAEPFLRGREQLHWIERLANDHDNLHAAFRGAVAARDGATAIRLIAALGWYWWLRGHRAEGAELGAEALAMPAVVLDATRAVAYAITALNAAESNRDFGQVREWFDSAVALAASATSGQADPMAKHPILRLIAPVAAALEAHSLTDPAAVQSVGEERALPMIAALFDDPDLWLRAAARILHGHALINLGRFSGTLDADFEAALAGFRALGDRWGIAFSLSAVAERAAHHGEHRQAAAA
jgi:hypothetical protein